jgi:hypothetical protein
METNLLTRLIQHGDYKAIPVSNTTTVNTLAVSVEKMEVELL